MTSPTVAARDAFLDLASGPGPLHARLTAGLRAAIRDGRLAPGSALPGSRQLAADLGCSRWVVTESYGQLVAEGYLDARPGGATRVSAAARAPVPAAPPTSSTPDSPVRYDLAPGLPDLRAFPRTRWVAAVRGVLDRVSHAGLGSPDAAGHPELREVVGAYLLRVRAAATDASHVQITHGASDAVVRVVRALLDDGLQRVAVEDPGWTRLREAIGSTGVDVVGVPVDEDGLDVDRLAASGAGAVVVAPAHQFPAGVVLSPARRAALLDWARRTGGLVIEDDYDAEFRYDRAPVATLHGMAPDRVALVGSVSKTLAPALGLGWVLAPPRFAGRLQPPVAATPPVLDQLALASLLASGGYDRHLRAARRRYRQRRDRLLTELDHHLPALHTTGAAAGLHLLLRLPDRVAGRAVVDRAATGGLRLVDLHRYRLADAPDDTLVIGYANLPDSHVAGAVEALRAAMG